MLFGWVLNASRVERLVGIWGDYLVGFTFFLVLLGLLHYKIDNVLYRHIATFFSKISYTLYLTHYSFLYFPICLMLKGQRYPFAAKGIVLYLILFSASILYAYIMYQLFEKNTPKVRDFLLKHVRSVRFDIVRTCMIGTDV